MSIDYLRLYYCNNKMQFGEVKATVHHEHSSDATQSTVTISNNELYCQNTSGQQLIPVRPERAGWAMAPSGRWQTDAVSPRR
jgi:hypothetical protein